MLDMHGNEIETHSKAIDPIENGYQNVGPIEKQKVYIFDIDGIIAKAEKVRSDFNSDKEYYHWFNKNCPFFKVIPEMCGLLAYCARRYHIILLTSRQTKVQNQTIQWLGTWITFVPSMHLYMREVGDERPTGEFKRGILRDKILPRYDVIFAVDDDASVIDEYRRLGVNCLEWKENR